MGAGAGPGGAPVRGVRPDGSRLEFPPEAGDPAEWGTPQGRRVTELLWEPPAAPRRGPRQKVSLGEVVAAAVALADAEGFDALSMRALARHLGLGAMSLYTYVPGKAELFELMIDHAYAERARPDPGLGWRERYAGHAGQALAMYRRHPWLVHSNLWRLPLGPGVLDVNEDMLRIGEAAGLDPGTRVRVASLLESYIFGIARGEIADRSEVLRTGESRDEYWAARSGFWRSHFDPRRFPAMLATWEQGGFDVEGDPSTDLGFALDLILDGVARLLAPRSG